MDFRVDHMALDAICSAILPEMISTLMTKPGMGEQKDHEGWWRTCSQGEPTDSPVDQQGQHGRRNRAPKFLGSQNLLATLLA
jgi:hypothetical protein